jgi:LmbE family N-acetylglucosaminyl deacetylase
MNLDFFKGGAEDSPRVILVSPHPDDEVIGAGARLPLLKAATVVEVTDGSPPDLKDAKAAGLKTREAYASTRDKELRRALALCGIENVVGLGIPDQEASFHLVELARRLRELIVNIGPEVLVTVPYEGGHPDHDATAFGVHLACEHLEDWQKPAIVEMLAYHNNNGRCEMASFLTETRESFVEIDLNPKEREFKRQLFDCFPSQEAVLRWFPIEVEKFRIAPQYDFSQPPHLGQLYYEMFPWGMKSGHWNDLAKAALWELRPLIEHV